MAVSEGPHYPLASTLDAVQSLQNIANNGFTPKDWPNSGDISIIMRIY